MKGKDKMSYKELLENIKDKEVRYKIAYIINLMKEFQKYADENIISTVCSLKVQLILKDELLKLSVNNNERN